MKSEQEQKICFALSALGVKFRYEEPYEHQVADEMHSQYKPDFSIHYEKNGQQKRIYLEHFAVDDHGMVPLWFAKERGITYEEANRLYGDGITWKKATHKKYGTTLLETSSADFHYYDIRKKLREMRIQQHAGRGAGAFRQRLLRCGHLPVPAAAVSADAQGSGGSYYLRTRSLIRQAGGLSFSTFRRFSLPESHDNLNP